MDQNRSWTIAGISDHALGVCFTTFQVFCIITALFWIFFGYRFFRVVLYQAGLLAGLTVATCVLASRINLEAWLLFLLSIGSGLTIGLIFLATRNTGKYLFAFMVGVLVGDTCIDQIPLIYFIRYNWISLIIILSFGVIFSILMFVYRKYEKLLLIPMISYSGSYIVGVSVSQLAFSESRFLLILNILSFPLTDHYFLEN